VLALKDNHPTLCADVRLWSDTEVARGRPTVTETVEKDHGRIEIRHYALSDGINWLASKPSAGAIGGPKTNSTGFWTSNSGKMPAEPASTTRRRTWPRSAAWPSTSFATTARCGIASAAANSAPPSMMNTGCVCSSARPVPLPHSAIALPKRVSVYCVDYHRAYCVGDRAVAFIEAICCSDGA